MKVRFNGDKYLHMNVFLPLPHTGKPAIVWEVVLGQTRDSPFIKEVEEEEKE